MAAVVTKAKRRRKIVLGPQDSGRRMPLDEFTHATTIDERMYELGRGVIEVAEVPQLIHAEIVRVVRKAIERFDDDNPGIVKFTATGSEAKVMSQEYQSERHADFMVYLSPAPNDRQPWSDWVPEIVVEVVSESSAKRDYEVKPPEYLAVGVDEYWIVDRFTKTITVNTRWRGTWKSKTLKPGQSYETRLLPGLKLDVRKILSAGK